MKNIIKQITPPIIWNLLRKFFLKEEKQVTYEGIFHSFDEVFKSYPSKYTKYNTSISLENDFNYAKEKWKNYEEGKIPCFGWENLRGNLFPTLLATSNANNSIKILDIGGGFGTSFIDLKYSCPKLEIDYYVLELPDTVEKANKSFSRIKNLTFLSKSPGKGEKFDVVLFGSSLQYFENYKEILEQVSSYSPELIVLNDHPMGLAPTFVCAQVNMKDRVIPRYIFNVNEITSILEKHKYKLILKTINFFPFHNFSNYTNEHAQSKHHNLTFKKI